MLRRAHLTLRAEGPSSSAPAGCGRGSPPTHGGRAPPTEAALGPPLAAPAVLARVGLMCLALWGKQRQKLKTQSAWGMSSTELEVPLASVLGTPGRGRQGGGMS